MEHDQRYGQDIPFVPHQSYWHEPGYHPHHHSPQNGYSMPGFSGAVPSYESPQVDTSPRQETYHHHAIAYPPYPSMLAVQTSYVSPGGQSQPMHCAQIAVSPPSHSPATPNYQSKTPQTQHPPNPRKTLSDTDRRKMCQYHKDNPTKKQTEIGEIFGVERSTVSKVLRQKEKYLVSEEDGSKSPVKKSKGKFTELERALANWARKQEKDGIELTDEMIKDRAQCFSFVTRNGHAVRESINDPQWLKEFKTRNKIGGARSRKGSLANLKKESPALFPAEPVPPPNDMETETSPVSLVKVKSPSISESYTSAETPSIPETDAFGQHGTVYHSQSNNSLSSAFGGTTNSTTFSTINTDVTSPMHTPETVSADTVPSSSSYFPRTTYSAKYSSPTSLIAESPVVITPHSHDILSAGPESSGWNQYENLQPSQLNRRIEEPMITHPFTTGQDLPHHVQTSVSPLSNPLPARVSVSISQARENARTNAKVQAIARYRSLNTIDPSSISPGASDKQPNADVMMMAPPQLPSQGEAAAAMSTVMEFLRHRSSSMGIEPREVALVSNINDKLKLCQDT